MATAATQAPAAAAAAAPAAPTAAAAPTIASQQQDGASAGGSTASAIPPISSASAAAAAPAASSASASASTPAPAADAPQSDAPAAASKDTPAADSAGPAAAAAESKATAAAPAEEAKEEDPAASQAAAEAAHADAYAPGDSSGLLPHIIDSDIFAQLLEMDDDEDDHDFSRGIVWNYFDQAETTFVRMDEALANADLGELSTLGHFLKGSSAAVGVIRVRDSCESMQHYGKGHDSDGITRLSNDDAVAKLTKTLRAVKVEYNEANIVLRRFYGDL